MAEEGAGSVAVDDTLVGPTLVAHDPSGVRVAPRELPPGSRVDRFEILRQLGAGGMGVVYEAHDPHLGRRVALKLLLDEGRGPEARERLLREAQAMARVTHPNVAAVHEVGSFGGAVFVAMELIDGVTLAGWFAMDHGWIERLQMLIRAGEGLAAAHAVGLVHRDFKPANVMIGAQGRPRVLDFGLVRATGGPTEAAAGIEAPPDLAASTAEDAGDALTRAGAILGTPAYMAPEQLMGADVDARSDQFSFCVCAYEALYGARPYRAGSLAELLESTRVAPAIPERSEVPRTIARIVLRGLDPEPARRWPSMTALLGALTEALARHADPQLDVAVGRRQRTILLAVLAVTMIGIVVAMEDHDPAVFFADPRAGLRFYGVLCPSGLVVLLLALRAVGRNRINRLLLGFIAALDVMLLVDRLIGVALDIGWPEVFVLDLAAVFGLSLIGGLAIHRWMYVIAALSGVAFGLACVFVEAAPNISFALNISALISLLVAWRGSRDQSRAEQRMTSSLGLPADPSDADPSRTPGPA